jgi:hypothetical protein
LQEISPEGRGFKANLGAANVSLGVELERKRLFHMVETEVVDIEQHQMNLPSENSRG